MKHTVKVIALCLLTAVLLTMCSCARKSTSEVEDSAHNAVESMSMPDIEAPSLIEPDDFETGGMFSSISEINTDSKNYEKIEIDTGYRMLQTEQQRYFYESLETKVYVVGSKKNDRGLYLTDKVIVDGSIDEKGIRVALSAFKNDHPEIFWLSNQFSYIASQSKEIQLYSVISPKDIKIKSKELITAIEFFINKVPEGLSEFERELKIHDLLLNTCVYNEEVESTNQDWRPFSIYGSLVDGSAVCEGYSRAMQYLLSLFGIECNTVNGMGKGNPHQWNNVRIDGSWYNLDATWDDTADNNIYYDYFNVSDSVIEIDHETAPLFSQMSSEEICGGENSEAQLFNIYLPECVSDKANFYTMKTVLYTGDNDESADGIIQKLVNCAVSGESVIYIMVDSALEYESVMNSLFYEPPYCFFKYIEQANEESGGLFDDEHVSVLKRERQNIIEVHLQYK